MSQSISLSLKQVIVTPLLGLFALFVSAVDATEESQSLDKRQAAMIPIAALTASGDVQTLNEALKAGLENGLTVNEIKEIFIHSYAYAGFPRALNGIMTFMDVASKRKAQGMTDEVGREATPLPDDYNADSYGHQVRNALVGRDMSNRKTGYAGFVPTIETFLVEHLFADIFYRDVLTVKDRELLTISMLSAIPGVEAQLTSHMKLSLRVGYSPAQLLEFTRILKDSVSQDSAIRASHVLSSVANIDVNNETTKHVTVSTDSTVTQGSPTNFSGVAKVSSRFTSPIKGHYRGALVEFEAGARTAWHTHPKGQTLIIISGKGLVQNEGGDIQQMLPGNVITIPPNTRHWHGAAPDSFMSHIAISTPDNGETVTWMELVSQEQSH
ncbi:carboxymuconolactone decarboxylase family protein [Alteromonas australica]|uniref:(R)-mandelonitrile lyase n=1 Tax=Alteromonas australica TaxID=589873 RepID=UPI000E900ED0|nr:carboxymuconolactone decarboxylase family protein [Alteromonas australica]HAD89375.1 carboxymuconolactone decarboxylase [Alteromonas macleodii]HBF73324.1 carboxymuconolactone decarboxylase [Alteromonas australica]|tara:strand:- start:3736 stop:4884 length:1149 start_codon:yes stop_codon:yes gene_type:complete